MLRELTVMDAGQADLQRQRQLAVLVRAVLQERSQVRAVLHEFRRFLAHGWRPGQDGRAVLQSLHTFKGLLAQWGFFELPLALHLTESALVQALAQQTSSKRMVDLVFAGDLQHALERDLAILSDVVGDDWEAPQGVWLDEDSVALIEHWAHARVEEGGSACSVLQRLARLRERSLHDVLRGYGRMMQTMAHDLGKALAPLAIVGPDIWLDGAIYQSWLASLVHVFRNAVVHGLESPEERCAAGKPPAGQLSCLIRMDEADSWQLLIGDDGVGIDADAWRERARSAGWDVTRSALADWVFAPGFSACSQLTMHSGRGVGLSAVRAALSELGGAVEIESAPGRGLCLTMTLPRKVASNQQKDFDDDMGRDVAG